MNIGRLLDEYLATVGPFDWKRNNCYHYTFGWLKYRGSPDYQPEYDDLTPRNMVRLLQQRGDLVSVVSVFFGRPPVPVTQLQIGDVLILRGAGPRGALAILAGRTAAVLAPTGVGHDRNISGLIGWKVK